MNKEPSPYWLELCEHEPRLQVLYDAFCSVDDDNSRKYFCANEVMRNYQFQIDSMVGWYSTSTDSFLHTEQAYMTTISTLFHSLPPCRRCGCVST